VKPVIDYTHNPFTDMLGNYVLEGDCVASPEVQNKTLALLNISVCEGYDDKGVILRFLNRRTGRWKRFFPRQNNNVIKVNMEESVVEDLKDVFPWVKEIRERNGSQRGG